MALLLPPQHTIDGPHHWVHPRDTAFDHETIAREQNAMADQFAQAVAERAKAEKRDPEQVADEMRPDAPRHPTVRYFLGESRFDLDAPMPIPEGIREGATTVTMRDYLVGKPVEFVLRKLGARDLGRVERLVSRDDDADGWILAVKLGVVQIHGGEEDGLVWKKDTMHRGMHEDVIDRLALVPGLMIQLGAAVITVSRSLTLVEKKR